MRAGGIVQLVKYFLNLAFKPKFGHAYNLSVGEAMIADPGVHGSASSASSADGQFLRGCASKTNNGMRKSFRGKIPGFDFCTSPHMCVHTEVLSGLSVCVFTKETK